MHVEVNLMFQSQRMGVKLFISRWRAISIVREFLSPVSVFVSSEITTIQSLSMAKVRPLLAASETKRTALKQRKENFVFE